MAKRILITGGAGFIGSHVAELLLSSGYAVRILDLFVPQVHGNGGAPHHVSKESELLVGDVCDPARMKPLAREHPHRGIQDHAWLVGCSGRRHHTLHP